MCPPRQCVKGGLFPGKVNGIDFILSSLAPGTTPSFLFISSLLLPLYSQAGSVVAEGTAMPLEQKELTEGYWREGVLASFRSS